MKHYILNYEITGCPNRCKHCYCNDIKSNHSFMSLEEVIELSKIFREKIEGEVGVLLIQEQTLYPNYIKVIERLKKEDLVNTSKRGLLVTNGFGLSKYPDLIHGIKEHYSTVKLTLFGTEYTHDHFVGRKGHFRELIEVTQMCHDNKLDVIWQMMLTKGNTRNIEELITVADELKVDGYFVTGAFNYVGSLRKNEMIIPHEQDLRYKTFHVYEQEHELFLPEYKYKEIKSSVDEYQIEKVSLENLYIDSEFNVYPVSNIEPAFKFGNMKTDMDSLIQMLNHHEKLPKLIKNRLSFTLRQLIDKHLDQNSTEMHTPQTLFEKLAYKKQM